MQTHQIPVIDLPPSEETDEKTGTALVDACASHGFVFVRGKGVGFSSDALNGIFELSRQFFNSALEDKQTCAIQKNNIGWSSMHSETLDPEHQQRGDFKEAMNFGEFKNGKAQQTLLVSLRTNESKIANFEKSCHDLCMRILRLFALGLKVDTEEGGCEWFASRHDPSKGTSGSVLRWLHYPKVEQHQSSFDNVKDIRAGAHSDYGFRRAIPAKSIHELTPCYRFSYLTFPTFDAYVHTSTLEYLPVMSHSRKPSIHRRKQANSQTPVVHQESGLEILTPESTWAPVPVNPPGTETDPFPPILVNVGDLMQFWTNGLLKSTVHRVVFPAGEVRDRYSIAYFCHPLDHIEIEAVPSNVVKAKGKESGEAMTKPITAEGYLKKRLAETYGWGKEQSPARD